MELETKEHNILKEIFSCLSNYNDEINIKFNEIGLSINCEDRSAICIIRVKILKLIFSKFNFEKDELISINLNDLNKILKLTKVNDTLNIKSTENKLILSINDNKKFSLNLFETKKEEFSEERKIDYDIELNLPKDKTIESISDLSEISEENIRLTINNNKLILSKDSTRLKGEILLLDKIDYKDKIAVKYNNKYILDYNNIIKIGNVLKLRLKNDSPIQLISELKNTFRAEFILAPLVDNE